MCGPGGCGRGPHAPRVRATAGSVVARLVVGCVRVWRRCERERERESFIRNNFHNGVAAR